MASAVPTANQAGQSSQPPPGATPASPPNKRDLKSWWKGFKLPSKHQEATESKAPGIFGVPLRQSITYANVAISLIDENGQSYIYGYVPIVVAKCGVFLKEKATGVEGIFRLSGSEKRIKELKSIFDSPDRYGKGLVWDGYTVHDAANVLRRYLNDLPEPVVPLDLYEKFREPLRGATKQAVGDLEGPQFVDNFDENAAIQKYQQLITELPPLNKQLLLYILDLLAVFAAKSDENRMNSQNLAAIFQPGMLSHPAHAMAPEEYRLNQCVLIFLIENQDHFLIGMQGTAADEETKKEVESGTPTGPLTPNPNKTSGGLDRSASNASAGATSVRRDGKVRRNRSVSSRHSRQEENTTPNSPALVATTPTGGLGRSNTVPSKRSPALAGGKFKRGGDNAGHQSPARVEPMTPVRATIVENEQAYSSSPAPATMGAANPSVERSTAAGFSQERLLEVPNEAATPPPRERNLPSLFQRSSPADATEKRQPNKLKKKRIPGALNLSAQSSAASLTHSNAASPGQEVPNPVDSLQHLSEVSPPPTSNPILHPASQSLASPSPLPFPTPISQAPAQQISEQGQSQSHPALPQQPSDMSSEGTPRPSNLASSSSLHPDDNLPRGRKSPPTSIHSSSFNEGSDLDQGLDEQIAAPSDSADKEKKKRWRLSRTKKDDNGGSTSSMATPPQANIGSNDHAEVSTTSIGSGASKPRKSFTNEGSEPTTLASIEGHGGQDARDSNSTKEESKGPIGWIRNKYREAKENAEQRRNKSPPAAPDRQGIGAVLMSRGKSLDMKREKRDDEKQPEKSVEELAAPKPTVTTAEEPSKETPKEVPQAALDATPVTASAHTAEAPAEAPSTTSIPEPTTESKSVASPEGPLEPVPESQHEEAAVVETKAEAQEAPVHQN
ncbi:GTPase activating protein (GAP) for Rho1p [Purpureocillium takamizusanense]|uniref:GTPase activating protein (GAP) for Rho1p n=1 Tax=Purpureocillium takamizusanense TaxID=2060973 RepID=A0A9Q8QKQ8_9HYPO|nr:GTPase activating protein (GAP) for Rho1p [Purpureocillium takamizusanense]UNI21390.1 GTPase activating protein (GAP) for Rho1p [Purpureocillium takamizusanense]